LIAKFSTVNQRRKSIMTNNILSRVTVFTTTATLILYCNINPAKATNIQGAISVSTNLGVGSSEFDISNIINKSGLFIPYTNGQDLNGYLAQNPFHTYVGQNNDWFSGFNAASILPGIVDFNLGSLFSITDFVLWNGDAAGIQNFDLVVSSVSDFSSFTSVGSFVANFNPNGVSYLPQRFSFSPANAQFVRLKINTSYPFTNGFISIGESAFGVGTKSIPESSSVLGLLALGTLGVGSLIKSKVMGKKPKNDSQEVEN